MAKKKIRATRERRPGRIFRQKRIDEAFGGILRKNKVIFLVDDIKFQKIKFANPEDKAVFHTCLYLIGNALRGLFQLHDVYEQMVVAHRMAERYPWDPRLIKRSEHLHFVWSTFVNLCYLFEEKFKLAATAHNSAAKALSFPYQISIKSGIKQISKGLGKHIQARGELTHQWRKTHEIIQQFNIMELANSTGGMPKDFKITRMFGLSRILIVTEMKQAITTAEDVLLEVIESHTKCLLPISAKITGQLELMAKDQKISRRTSPKTNSARRT